MSKGTDLLIKKQFKDTLIIIIIIIIIRLLFNGFSKRRFLSNAKVNDIPSIKKQTHCMDYNRTSSQLGTSGKVIVKPDLS